MSDLTKCDRCDFVGHPFDFERVSIIRGAPTSLQPATFEDVDRGKAKVFSLTKVPGVDLCKRCRQDLRDFLQNLRVEPRRP